MINFVVLQTTRIQLPCRGENSSRIFRQQSKVDVS
jgi:hypothetical protein